MKLFVGVDGVGIRNAEGPERTLLDRGGDIRIAGRDREGLRGRGPDAASKGTGNLAGTGLSSSKSPEE